jgi:hypothetical protein
VRQVIYVIIVVVLVIVIIGAVVIRRKSDSRGISYAPDPNIRPGGGRQVGVRPGPGAIPEIPINTPELNTEVIAHNEFVSDVSDDLLDPNNPRHSQWLKDHPAMETDAERSTGHPEDNPT